MINKADILRRPLKVMKIAAGGPGAAVRQIISTDSEDLSVCHSMMVGCCVFESPGMIHKLTGYRCVNKFTRILTLGCFYQIRYVVLFRQPYPETFVTEQLPIRRRFDNQQPIKTLETVLACGWRIIGLVTNQQRLVGFCLLHV